jgi:hypothetical protein
MIHYHGTPVGGRTEEVVRFLAGRHALVSYIRQDDIGAVAEVAQSFVLDNGAFTVWRRGGVLDYDGYVEWVTHWHRHPGFDWALIPDVIDGDEHENDEFLHRWADTPVADHGVPVWHLHESLDRLVRLCSEYRTVALGSSGDYQSPGSVLWWGRMRQAMNTICDDHGRPDCKLHGLRMLDPTVFTRLPLASADSANASINSGSMRRFGIYKPPTSGQRAAVIAARIEAHNSAPVWLRSPSQQDLFTLESP